MKTLSDYLDDAKKLTGSDYATAKRLKVTRQAISTARKKGIMRRDQAVELAKLLDVNPVGIMAACDIAAHPENKEWWGKWVAASVILSVLTIGGFSFTSDAYADSVMPYLYIMRNFV